MTGEIHEDEHPFVTADAERDPVRQLRGRLAAPVTVITAGDGSAAAGLTISSLMLAEGDPGTIHFLLGPSTDLAEAIEASGRMVVHVLSRADRDLSEIFAGRRPNPGGPFGGVRTAASMWGPVLERVPDRAFCSDVTTVASGYSLLVSANIDRVEVVDLDDPLVYFRGAYRSFE
jgi:flavin reductase (DIM6/NTAB) family NADH-FMN oxidoreductase RutF